MSLNVHIRLCMCKGCVGTTLCTSSPCNSVPFTTNPLPVNELEDVLLGVYWAEANTTRVGHGNFYYYQSDPDQRNNDVINRINEIIAKAFLYDTFGTVEFLIVTWESVIQRMIRLVHFHANKYMQYSATVVSLS